MVFTTLLQRLFASLATGFLFLAPADALAADSIVIGHVVDLSGPAGAIGRDYSAGIQTYFDMLNGRGGLHGRRVEYVAIDDRGDPATAAAAAGTLIKQRHPEYLLGGVADDTTRAILVTREFKESGLSLFAPLAPLASNRVVPWRPHREQELAFLLKHFHRSGVTTAALVIQEGPHGSALPDPPALFRKAGLQLVASVKVRRDGDDITSQAGRLAAARPGVVIVIADTIGMGQFLKTYRQSRPAGFVAGTSLVDLTMLRELAGSKALEWTVLSQVVPDPAGSGSRLQVEHAQMMRKFRDEPASPLTLEGFAVAKSLRLLIESGRISRGPTGQTVTAGPRIDLGGFTLSTSEQALSTHLDVALLREGGRLRY